MGSIGEQRELAAGILVGRIRNLQATYESEHAALVNWGHWSADRRGIFPTQAPPGIWDEFKRDENEAYGEVAEDELPELTDEAKTRKAEHLPTPEYDERKAVELDERIHGHGGLPVDFRHALRAAYVTREIPEHQFPREAGCTDDAFCERLESCLLFVGRFVDK